MHEVKVTEVPPNAQLIDARDADKFAEVHAVGAVNIPMDEFDSRLAELDTDRDIYVICQLGKKSAKVVDFLASKDVDAINVDGGTKAWVEAGLPTVEDEQG